jgi:hypothetical protein
MLHDRLVVFIGETDETDLRQKLRSFVTIKEFKDFIKPRRNLSKTVIDLCQKVLTGGNRHRSKRTETGCLRSGRFQPSGSGNFSGIHVFQRRGKAAILQLHQNTLHTIGKSKHHGL